MVDLTRWAQGSASLNSKSYLWAGWLVLAAAESRWTCPASQEALCFALTAGPPQLLPAPVWPSHSLFQSHQPAVQGSPQVVAQTEDHSKWHRRGVYSHWYLVFICLCCTSFYTVVRATVWSTLLWLGHSIFQALSVGTVAKENPEEW